MKYLISLYIVVVLLLAGMAQAGETSLVFSRVQNVAQMPLAVSKISFDSSRDILNISGPASADCFQNIHAVTRLDTQNNEALISVTGDARNCAANVSSSSYNVVIDLKAFFAENPVPRESVVRIYVDNYNGDVYSFDYDAKRATQYQFNSILAGILVRDSSNKYMIVSKDSSMPILARFDLSSFENKPVFLKGLIPEQFVLDGKRLAGGPQLIVSQLVALK